MTVVSVAAASSAVLLAVIYLSQALKERSHNRTFADYFFHRWSLGAREVASTLFSSAMSLATVVVAILHLTGVLGLGLCFATLSFCAGWFLIQRTAPRIRARLQPSDTLHSFIGRYYASGAIRASAAIVTTIGLIGLFATELFAVDALVEAVGWSPTIATPLIVLFGVFAIAHASLGGFRAVIRSDTLQNVLLLLSLMLLLLLGFLVWKYAHFPPLPYKGKIGSFVLPLPVLVGLFMINVPFPFVDTLTWQRLIASTSNSDYIRGSRYAVFGFCITWTLLVLVGLLVAASVSSGDPLAVLVGYCASLPKLVGFLLAFMLFPGLLAAMLSSSDAFLNSAAHTWCLDVAGYRKFRAEDFVRDKASVHVIWLGLCGLIAALGLRRAGFNIVDMIFAVYAGTLALLPSVLHAIFAKRTLSRRAFRVASLVSMFFGLLAAWLTGLFATVSYLRATPLATQVARLLLIDVYQAPTYALLTSGFLYLAIGCLFSVFLREKEQ